MQERGRMALIGALAGISLYLLTEGMERGLLPDRLTLALASFAAAFFFGWMAMAGPLTHRRAATAAGAVGAGVTLLMTSASRRYDAIADYLDAGFPLMAGVVLATVPLPFLMATGGGQGWRHYPSLFTHAWTIVVRFGTATAFTGLVWGVIFLSDTLFGLVGLNVIETLLDLPGAPWIITGATLGLALAVVAELEDVVSPNLLLLLLRLLVPVVLVVLVVFLLALPVRGLSALFGEFSVAATLLSMVGVSATLVTTAVDQDDAQGAPGLPMQRAARALAAILVAPAVLAAWAVGLRVAQYGLTPDRVFAALLAVLMMAYGIVYAFAALRRGGWRDRIRVANRQLALAVMAAAALWLSPLLNAERLSAQSLLARITDGRLKPEAGDVVQLDDWGRAGADARRALVALAAAPERASLALALQGAPAPQPELPVDPVALRALLAGLLPLNPPGATDARDRVLARMDDWAVGDIVRSCRIPMPGDGAPGCVMVLADLAPRWPGDEALVVRRDDYGYVSFDAWAEVDGVFERRSVGYPDGYPVDAAKADAMLRTLQSGPLRLEPVPFQQVIAGGSSLTILP